jgi:hypothetical protein
VPPRRRAIDLGAARGRGSVALVSRELEEAIRNTGLTYAAVGRAVGLSGSQVGRVARGEAPGLSIVQAATLLAAVGLDLSVRAYPLGQPLRDAGHLDLLRRLRSRIHPSLGWQTEVPIARRGDLRSWDAAILGADWRVCVEAETRLRDLQALDRRIALKRRDGAVDVVILLVANTRHNRAILRAHRADVASSFPESGDTTLELLAAGAKPLGSSLVLL